MTGRQRQLGATEPDEVIPAGLPAAVAHPTSLAEFAGWSGDDIFAWLEQVGVGLRRVREGVGLALLAMREATPSDVEYGARVEQLAALYDVHRGTLWRWREQARTAVGAPPSGRAKRATSPRALPPADPPPPPPRAGRVKPPAEAPRGATPDGTDDQQAPTAAAQDAEPAVESPQEPPPAPSATTSPPEPAEPSGGQGATPTGQLRRWLQEIAVTPTERLRDCGHVTLRDAVDRLAQADGRRLVTVNEWRAYQASQAAPAVPSPGRPGPGRPLPTPPTSTPAGIQPCGHPAGKRTVSGTGMVGCGACGARKVGVRWVGGNR